MQEINSIVPSRSVFEQHCRTISLYPDSQIVTRSAICFLPVANTVQMERGSEPANLPMLHSFVALSFFFEIIAWRIVLRERGKNRYIPRGNIFAAFILMLHIDSEYGKYIRKRAYIYSALPTQ